MPTTETETTIGTLPIFPRVTLVPAVGGSDYDLAGVGADIDALEAAVEDVSGALIFGVKTKYKMEGEGFQIVPVEGTSNNRKNPYLTYEATWITPAPDGSGTTITAKITALLVANEGGLYDMYAYDSDIAADAWCAKMTNVKVKALPTSTPEGMKYAVTVTGQVHGSFDARYLPQTAPA